MKSSISNKVMEEIRKLKFANFQFSIFNFAKRNGVASLFGELIIDNYLKIVNWKLKIRDLIKNVISSGIKLPCENSLV